MTSMSIIWNVCASSMSKSVSLLPSSRSYWSDFGMTKITIRPSRGDAYELTSNIADRAELGTDTDKVWLDDLRLLGIVDRACAGVGVQAGYTWRLTGELQQTITLAGALDDDGTDVPGSDPDSDPRDGCVGGVPPDPAPQTPGIELGMAGRSGVPNRPPPPSHVTVDDDSDRWEREEIMAVEAEAEAAAIRASGGDLTA